MCQRRSTENNLCRTTGIESSIMFKRAFAQVWTPRQKLGVQTALHTGTHYLLCISFLYENHPILHLLGLYYSSQWKVKKRIKLVPWHWNRVSSSYWKDKKETFQCYWVFGRWISVYVCGRHEQGEMGKITSRILLLHIIHLKKNKQNKTNQHFMSW